MKTSLLILAFVFAVNLQAVPDSLVPMGARHAHQRPRQESLKLIEKQLAELEALAKQAKGREAKRVREAIEVLRLSTI
jgi:hypothetical protein